MVYGAGVLVLIVALFYGALDVGQLVTGKIQAQNAADAASLAASGLKTSLHNTRVMAYRAAAGQTMLARIALVKATGLALQEISKPGSASDKAFKEAFKRSRIHRARVTKLSKGLKAFNAWATSAEVAPVLVRQAAAVAYRGNLGTLAVVEPGNLRLIEREDAFMEFKGGMVGSVAFTAEALSPNGHAGKSLVHVKPSFRTFGSGMLGYAAKGSLEAVAVAGPVEAHDQYGSLPGLDRYGTPWFTVRLMPVGKGNLD